jgi:hypothetical protein
MLAILASLAAMAVVASTLAGVVRLRRDLPTYDHWAAVAFADETLAHGLRAQALLGPHNEHRIAVPRLLFLVDFFAGGGRGIFLLAASLLVQAAHALLLWRLIHTHAPLSRAGSVAAAALVALAAFSSVQMFNFVEPFQVQFVLVHAAATLALAAAVRGCTPGAHVGWWLLALLAGAISALSMANGVIVLPMLIALAFWLRVRRARLAGFALCAGAMLVAWPIGMSNAMNQGEVGANLSHPLRMMAYVACWVGSPLRLWDGQPRVIVAGIGGGLLLLGFAVIAGPILCRRQPVPVARCALAWTGAFLVATALVVAVGRADAYSANWLNDRYATPCHLFWIVTCGLMAGHAVRAMRCASIPLALIGAIALLWQQQAHLEQTARRQQVVREAELAVLSGVRDPATMRDGQQPFLSFIYELSATLHHRRWSVFASSIAGLVGSPLAEHFAHDADAAVTGSIDCVTLVPGTGWGCRVLGWAWDGQHNRAPQAIVLVGDDGIIVGVAACGTPRPDVAAVVPGVDADCGFVGYAAVSPRRPTLTAWCVLGDGRTAAPFAAHLADPNEMASAVPPAAPGVEVVSHNAHRQLSGPAQVELDVGDAYATLEHEPGGILIGPLPQRAGVLALPVQVGPCSWGLSVQLIDLATRRSIATLHPPPTHGHWAVWRVPVPPDVVSGPLGFVAVDLSARPGAWLAVGKPGYLD